MKKGIITAVMALSTLAATAQYRQSRTIVIWDNASAPHSNYLTGTEEEQEPWRVANTVEAVLYAFDADPARSTGQAVIICPGGGYGRLAMDHEGFMPARWLAENGIAAYVLKYRMPNGHPEVPLEDAVEALRIVRSEAAGHGIDPSKVGVMGFSAGGHLAAYVSNFAAEGERPDFSILFYPVISCEEEAVHKGSFDNLLGSGRTAEESRKYSLERCVTPQTPATLLLLSDDDTAVPSPGAAYYYTALKRNGVRASMTIFPSGGHGWGDRAEFAYHDEWRRLLLRWLEQLK